MEKEDLLIKIEQLKDESNSIGSTIYNLEQEKYAIDQEIENLERELNEHQN